jgi:diamine N-acetyltransferase
MAKEVRLKDVTAANWEAVVDLELSDDQLDLVASNAYSIAESKFTPLARPRAVYAGKSVVGFLMYEPLADEGKPHEASIYRFMIDRKHQGKGYGRAALAQAIDEIRAISGIRKITICYMADNAVAKRFYGSLGFVETGRDRDGEITAAMTI